LILVLRFLFTKILLVVFRQGVVGVRPLIMQVRNRVYKDDANVQKPRDHTVNKHGTEDSDGAIMAISSSGFMT
jgi:hypothetical protein